MLGLVCCYYYESGVIQVIELCECGVGITGWCSGSSPVTHHSQYKYRITTIPVSTHSHPCIPRSYELKKNFNNLAYFPLILSSMTFLLHSSFINLYESLILKQLLQDCCVWRLQFSAKMFKYEKTKNQFVSVKWAGRVNLSECPIIVCHCFQLFQFSFNEYIFNISQNNISKHSTGKL